MPPPRTPAAAARSDEDDCCCICLDAISGAEVFRTPCCNRLHCFNCHVAGGHPGLTCDQFQAQRNAKQQGSGHTSDIDIVTCPKCFVSLVKGDGSEGSGVPGFWLGAMKNHHALQEKITEKDEEVLQYLTDVRYTVFHAAPEGDGRGPRA